MIVYWQVSDRILNFLNFFSADFVKFFIVSISFKNMFLGEIKRWVLPLYTDLIGRLRVTDKSEGSKGVGFRYQQVQFGF